MNRRTFVQVGLALALTAQTTLRLPRRTWSARWEHVVTIGSRPWHDHALMAKAEAATAGDVVGRGTVALEVDPPLEPGALRWYEHDAGLVRDVGAGGDGTIARGRP